ncbi:hypothetical protein PHMEG_00040713 [Phytophthora megakarya]|uniref:Uncharacterized protein n=1 Tax=Phytophthora megakarya TaxID=4795 RepID=A0A225UCT2_9STRA|nr:hypothetical protein PHMEG_00040713 [Phytophthora megakarya]
MEHLSLCDTPRFSSRESEFSDAVPPRPSPAKWCAIKCLRTLLAPFAAATDRLEGQDYPTCALALPCLRHGQS